MVLKARFPKGLQAWDMKTECNFGSVRGYIAGKNEICHLGIRLGPSRTLDPMNTVHPA